MHTEESILAQCICMIFKRIAKFKLGHQVRLIYQCRKKSFYFILVLEICDFPLEPFLRFTEKEAKKRKYPVSSSVGENSLFWDVVECEIHIINAQTADIHQLCDATVLIKV